MNRSDALQSLSDAHGPKALASAFAVLQGTVRRARRAAKREGGMLAQTVYAALDIWDQQKADGVSRAERLAGLEKTLRAAWPQTREWKYLCQCNDLGLKLSECPGDSTCGRHRDHLPHTFGTPCWCPTGAKYREKPKADPADFKAAGMTKVGKR